MNTNIKVILIIVLGIIALYFTKGKYSNYSKNKSISACTIAQKKKSKDMNIEQIKKYCEEQINKNLSK
tara:strand:+ start:83 stop:286 length:204 start_codon:yes stop_codon:yes gene_type:complete